MLAAERNLREDILLHVTRLYESNIDLSSPALENGWYTVRKMDVAM